MVEVTEDAFEQAARKVFILERELDITNADHIVLWLEASKPLDEQISWLACRIIEAHEIEVAKSTAERDALIADLTARLAECEARFDREWEA